MARGKKFHFTYGTQNNEQHTVEIWVEGFAGTSEELQPAAMPVVVDYNKTVAESYMGGIVPAQITINVQSSSTFKASVFTSQNYGDVIIKHKTGSTVDFNCVLVPFVTRDIDLPDGAYGVELSCEFGLNYLKNVDYPTSTNRVKLATVLHTCISYVPVEDTFSYKILDGVLVASDSYGTDATRYFESYVSEENYADKTCYEVLDDICQGIREIFFSDGYWWVRNLAEINKGDSTIYNYSSAGAYVDSTAYARPTTEAGAGVRLKGAFGKEFSHKNVKITKPKSIPIVQFSEGEFDDLTDWTFEGLAALLFDTEDGKLTNLGNTIWNQTAEADPNYIVNTNPFTYQPFKNNYDLSDNEVLTLKLLAENGGQIKNLRLQIIAQQDDVYGHIYFLDSDGAWYRQDASTTQTPMYLVKNTNTEVKIEIPRPPYNSATFFTSYLLPIGVYEGLNYLIPPVGNVDYNIYIRIYLPERINDNSSGGADRFSLIDYVRFSIEKTGSEVFDGFSKDYGVTSPTDRTGKLDISFSTGFNAYPHGAETLFDASTGEKYLPYFKGVADILYNLVDDFVSRQYLDILSIRHKSWIGELYEKVDFDDLIEIDSVKYRVHNLKLDRWNKISKVTLVELASSTSSPDSYVIELPEDIKLQIEKIVKSNAEKLIFNNENFEISYGAGGLKELRLRPNSVFDQFSSKLGLANLLKEGNESTTALNWTDIDGTVTDYIRPKADGFFYLKTEGNSEEQIATADTAWMLGATNALSAASSIGSASGNYDINLKRAGTTIATLKSTGLAVPTLTSGYLPKAGTGGLLGNSAIYQNGSNIGIGTVSPARLLDVNGQARFKTAQIVNTGANVFTFGSNSLGLYLYNNTTVGAPFYVLNNGNFIVGASSGTKKLTVNGDIQGTELTLTSLTSGYLPKAGTGGLLGNSLIYDNGTNIGLMTTSPQTLLDVRGEISANLGSASAPAYSFVGDLNTGVFSPAADTFAVATGGVERFRITSTGLGIGTTASSAIHAAFNGGSSILQLQRTTFSAGAAIGAVGFSGNTGQYVSGFTGHYFGVDNSNGYLVFRAGASSSSIYSVPEVFRIVSGNLLLGTTSGTKKLTVNGDIQGTEITLTTGASSGYILQSDSSGKGVWTSPAALVQYKGSWNPTTNSPSLSDGTGTVGDYYRILNTFSRDLGSGTVEWTEGYDVRYNGSIWEELPVGSLAIASDIVLGGVKIGSTVEVDGSGVLNQKSGVATAGTYRSVTVDTYGRVTAGTNPTTIAGYGITNAYTKTEIDTTISGLVTIATAQTITGKKTFSDNLKVHNITFKKIGSPTTQWQIQDVLSGSNREISFYSVAEDNEVLTIRENFGVLVDGKLSFSDNLIKGGSVGSDLQVYGSDGTNNGWKTLDHSYISDWNTYVTNPINTLSNTITSIMSTYLFRVDNNYVPIWNPNGNWSNSYAYQANGDFFINADTCIFGVLRGSYYETPSADQFYKVKSDASGIEAVTLDSTFITEVLSLTEGSFSRNIEGLYLTKEDAAETVFIGTDLNTGAAVIRNKYYDDNDDVKAWEFSLDIYEDGRPILYDPDTEASTRYVMFLDEFEDLFNEYKSQLPTGEGGGIVPSLQTVLDNTTGTTTKRISFDNSPYVTLTELNAAIAQIPTGGGVIPNINQVLGKTDGETDIPIRYNGSPYLTRAQFDSLTSGFGGAQGLESVLQNGAIATNQEINFKDDSASGTGLDTGLLFLDENGSEKGRISYRNNANEMFLLSDYMFMTGTNISILASGILSFGSSIPSYADNNAAILGGLEPGNVYRTGDILKIVH